MTQQNSTSTAGASFNPASHLVVPTLFPHFIGEVFIAFTELSCKFLGEVHAGDTLYPVLEITALIPEDGTGTVVTAATVHNQRGELVLSGEHKYRLRR